MVIEQPAMKTNSCCSGARVAAYSAAILGMFLIVAGLVSVMKRYLQPAPASQARIAERHKAAEEVKVAGQQLQDFGVIDKAKGKYQLRIDQAVDMVQQKWKNPAAGRADLIARVEKFNAPPPPPPSFE